MHCYQEGLLSFSISLFWVNSFIVGNCSIPLPPLSVPLLKWIVIFFSLNCSCLAWFQFVSSYSVLNQEAGSPHAVCVVFMVSVMFTTFSLYRWSLFAIWTWVDTAFRLWVQVGSVSTCRTSGVELRCLKFTAVVWMFVLPVRESICKFCSRCWFESHREQNGA